MSLRRYFGVVLLFFLCCSRGSSPFLKQGNRTVLNQSPQEKLLHLLVKGSRGSGSLYAGNNAWGGFANSFQGLRGVALWATVNRLRFRSFQCHLLLRIVCWSNFFKIMDSSIGALSECGRYTMFVDYRPSLTFLDKTRSYYTEMTEDLSSSLLHINGTMDVLVSLGLFESIPSIDDVVQLFSETLFRPRLELKSYVDGFLRNLHSLPSLGVQIRTGGNLADVREDNCFFTNETIYRVLDKINDVISEHYITDYNLFISTDSSFVLDALKHYFPQLMFASPKFSVGHTSLYRNGYQYKYIDRALIDLSILSNCTYLIFTQDSSYGRLSSVLSHSNYKYIAEWK